MSVGMPLPPPAPWGSTAPTPVVPERGPVARRLGVALIVLGLLAGVLLSLLALAAPRTTVREFARARPGCTTTLRFDRTGSFTVYLETKGRTRFPESACGAGSYEHRSSDVPRVSIELVASDGARVEPQPTSGHRYRLGAYRGDEVARLSVAAPGEYRMTVTSTDDVAVAVGGDPYADQRLWAIVAIVTTLLGVLMGGTLVLLNRR